MSRASALSKQKLLKVQNLAAASRLRTLTRRVCAPPRASVPGGGTHTHRLCRRYAYTHTRSPACIRRPVAPHRGLPSKATTSHSATRKADSGSSPDDSLEDLYSGRARSRLPHPHHHAQASSHGHTLWRHSWHLRSDPPAPKHPHLAHLADAPPTLTGPGLGRGVTPPPHLDVAPHHRRSPPHPPLARTGTVAATAITSAGIAVAADVGGLARRVPMASPAPSSPVHLSCTIQEPCEADLVG